MASGPVGFPGGLRDVAVPAVPLYDHLTESPPVKLDRHLDHTAIPNRFPDGSSLGVFPDRNHLLLASFAERVSNGKER